MPADEKAQAIRDAAHDVIVVAKRLLDIANGVLEPIAEDVEPSAAKIAELKAKAIVVYADWDIKKVALDNAKNA